ncbi:hypothetical protein ACWCOP_05975 [Maricaulaceae bacterium MS644]
MSKIDRLLDEVWAKTDTHTWAVRSAARPDNTFVLRVMEAVARRRLRAELATRLALVVALFAAAWGLAPVVSPLALMVISAQGAAALNGAALFLAAALSVGFAARKWLAGGMRRRSRF